MPYIHVSVMPVEVNEFLNAGPGKTIVDCTLGGSGHARAIAEKIVPDGLLIGIDQDADAIENAKTVLEPFSQNICLFHDNFVNLPDILSQLDVQAVDGILLDLGLSFHHIAESGRGFSFQKDEPLDMRMDIRTSNRADNIINSMDEKSLANILFKFGEERNSRQIARSIVKARQEKPIHSSKDLANIIKNATPGKRLATMKIHPATRVFMALRIAVNTELDNLRFFMDRVQGMLNPGGRLCVLSFHSLEDRIVKQKIRELEKGCTCPPDFPQCVCNKEKTFRSISKKVLTPGKDEVSANPMARSVKMRVAERL